jgi:hypothetical protein
MGHNMLWNEREFLFSGLHRFEYKAKLRKLKKSFGNRMGRAVAHLSFKSSIVSSCIPRARRRTPLMVVLMDSTTPNRT